MAPARNCTWETTAPPDPGVAVAEIVTAVPAVTTDPIAGAVNAIAGGEFATLMVIGKDVTVVPLESVACAVIVDAPAIPGIHAVVNGADPTVAINVAPSKKLTLVMVDPAIAAAEAVRFVGNPTVAAELLAGALRETDVALTAVTETAAEVALTPFVSVTLAVRLKLAAAEGVQLIE